MNLLRIFGIGKEKILAKNCSVKGTVTLVADSYIHVVKKPVRIGITPENTIIFNGEQITVPYGTQDEASV